MKCPHCSHDDTKVLESRTSPMGDSIRRRRACESCHYRFTTLERIHEKAESHLPMVIKKDDRREPFQREKLHRGLSKACQKRPLSTDRLDKLVLDLEHKIMALNLKEVSSREIGHLVMAALHSLDKVAYVRFASVYREFQDVEEFVADLTNPPEQKK